MLLIWDHILSLVSCLPTYIRSMLRTSVQHTWLVSHSLLSVLCTSLEAKSQKVHHNLYACKLLHYYVVMMMLEITTRLYNKLSSEPTTLKLRFFLTGILFYRKSLASHETDGIARSWWKSSSSWKCQALTGGTCTTEVFICLILKKEDSKMYQLLLWECYLTHLQVSSEGES